MSLRGWIGVDFDGVLAHYEGWQGPEHLGAPVPEMVERVKGWLAQGQLVRIFTARVAGDDRGSEALIQAWCQTHLGEALPVTCTKDYGMIRLYDDRCVQVETNTGRLIGEETR